jgi:NAD(P)-dependent dehydrogenase (short-subunit alcohol dehydrogenase family)
MSVCLITGASRGIGRATALRAAQAGWRVLINYAGNDAAAAETVAAISAAGGTAHAVRGDVSAEADVGAMFDAAQALGPVTGVVVNAGVIGPVSKLADMDAARIRRIVDVNVTGALFTAREAAQRLSTARGGPGGSVVIVSSAAARIGSPNEFTDYAATKGAMDTLTLGLSKELGPEGVRVNAIRPGLIDTEIHAAAGWASRADDLGGGTPLGRAGTADECAEAIVWLLSEQASYVSGAILDVAGGR